jgi:hypothetical protein
MELGGGRTIKNMEKIIKKKNQGRWAFLIP